MPVINKNVVLISGMAGSCIAVVLIAILFETLKSYKPNQQKPRKENSETTPLIRRPNQDLTRYKICYKMLKVCFSFWWFTFVLTIFTRVLNLYWFDWDNFSPVGVGFSCSFFGAVILQAWLTNPDNVFFNTWLRWLNTVLWVVSGNSCDGTCFKFDKQTWQQKKQWYTEADFWKSTH